MKRFDLFFIALLFFFSCSNKEDQVPEGILVQDKMQKVMWDIMRADELVNYQAGLDSTINTKQKSIELYSQIFAIHKISEQEFKRSFTYYQKEPGQLRIVLDSLRTRTEKALPAPIKKSVN